MAKLKDITGQVFGRLTVIEKVKREGSTRAFWLCSCECGNSHVASGKHLRSGAIVSCGCRMRETSHESKIDLTGRVFGCLTVTGDSNKKNKNGHTPYCKCSCSCGKTLDVLTASLTSGHTKSCGCVRMTSEANHNWVGGASCYGYDASKHRMGYVEKLRRDPENLNAVQVKCSSCDKWFTPTRVEVAHRIASLEGYGKGDSHFYCSNECKQSCSIFNQKKYPKGQNPHINERQEIVDPEIRILALNRDSYKCQKCGATEDLDVHHIEGVMQEPMLANDLDNTMTVCHSCHVDIHAQPGCSYYDYQRASCEEKAKEAVSQ